MALTNYTGVASVPGAQILVQTYPDGHLAWLLPTNSNTVADVVLANPLTTDAVTGAYDFWAIGPVVITELQRHLHVAGEPFTGDGVTVAFVLAHAPTAGSVAVYVNGLRVTNWTRVGATVTFAVAPAGAAVILIDYVY